MDASLICPKLVNTFALEHRLSVVCLHCFCYFCIKMRRCHYINPLDKLSKSHFFDDFTKFLEIEFPVTVFVSKKNHLCYFKVRNLLPQAPKHVLEFIKSHGFSFRIIEIFEHSSTFFRRKLYFLVFSFQKFNEFILLKFTSTISIDLIH